MNLLSYVPGNSFLHRLNPVTKLIAAFLYAVAAIMCENVLAEILFIVFMIFISYLAGMGQRAIKLTRTIYI